MHRYSNYSGVLSLVYHIPFGEWKNYIFERYTLENKFFRIFIHFKRTETDERKAVGDNRLIGDGERRPTAAGESNKQTNLFVIFGFVFSLSFRGSFPGRTTEQMMDPMTNDRPSSAPYCRLGPRCMTIEIGHV